MSGNTFWRWYDWFWRAYDWGDRIGYAGAAVSAIGGVVIGVVTLVDGWSPPAILLAGLGAAAALAIIYLGFCELWDRLSPSPFSLKYLSYRDAELGPAIISMAHKSAWGRWCAAQHLVNSGAPLNLHDLYQRAASKVMERITNGDLNVRGRRPDPKQLGYEPIDRTYWQSSWLCCIADPNALWKIKLIPKGGVEMDRDGTIIRANNANAAQRTSLLDYDHLIVDAYQFEGLWPKRQKVADKERRKFLWEARRRDLDKDEIRRLS